MRPPANVTCMLTALACLLLSMPSLCVAEVSIDQAGSEGGSIGGTIAPPPAPVAPLPAPAPPPAAAPPSVQVAPASPPAVAHVQPIAGERSPARAAAVRQPRPRIERRPPAVVSETPPPAFRQRAERRPPPPRYTQRRPDRGNEAEVYRRDDQPAVQPAERASGASADGLENLSQTKHP